MKYIIIVNRVNVTPTLYVTVTKTLECKYITHQFKKSNLIALSILDVPNFQGGITYDKPTTINHRALKYF